ncbi:hypothetical protein L4C36_23500 [Photobacterium japonica]|uniref:DUF6547 family protein n=1 Tax=Photobacterium japonica TaxID=2910235 RepID=UPI003D139EAF
MRNIDIFGQLIAKDLRDSALERCLDILQEKVKSKDCLDIHNGLSDLSDEQLSVVRRLVTHCIDTGIHDFLFAVDELQDEMPVSVNAEEIAKESDGLQGEIFTDDGWFAKYSKYGESGI